ncbi:hypothetical protein QR680_002567 [Steinernema hermaphroditum]|uniref:Amino acid transporter n=1 Tax=Steinernema hermaphroditum TaxID=289476 RepID=A0AA39H360_9BILA|nr:hypothetical protein QR680_002567 [Steinernema hermaphroditum]
MPPSSISSVASCGSRQGERRWRLVTEFMHRNLLLTLTIAAVVLGVALGFVLRSFDLNQDTIQLINFPGEIFMQVLKLMILPLIFSSLISALAQMDAKESGQMGAITILYYMTTTVLSTITGIVMVMAIHPGDPTIKNDFSVNNADDSNISPLDTFLDLVRNMFPENIVQATFERVQTSYVMVKPSYQKKTFNGTIVVPPLLRKSIVSAEGMNILGIIVFCTGFGIVISKLGEKARIVVEFFVILDAVIMRFVETVMWLAPVGITCLICGNLLDVDDLSDTAQVLMMYVITVFSALMFHTVVTMPGLYFLTTRRNPFSVMKGMLQAVVTAFGTGSSGAALPMSMQCMEENLKVDRRITRFVLPLGCTINMDGNALYEAVAVIFIAQLNNVQLSLAEVVTVSLTATIASLGLGSVPAGLVSILLILGTLGLPAKDVSLIITVDWLLDRIRTAINVIGDGYATGVVSHFITKRLEESDKDNEFREEIREEIDLLRSASSSRRQSNVWSEIHSNNLTVVSLPRSLPRSRRESVADNPLSWRKTTLYDTLMSNVSLNKVQNV